MKNLNEILAESLNIEKCHVICTKELKTKYHDFKPGEEVDATRINKDWWIIDSIGIDEKSFKTFFKENK